MPQLETTRRPETAGLGEAAPLDVLLPTIGSAGDVHPVIALGIALQKRGHRATVITNPFFEQQVRDSGLDFAAMGSTDDVEKIILDPRLWHPIKGFSFLAGAVIVPSIVPLYEIIRERRRSNTVVAASGICFGARIAQEKLGVPLVTVHLQPALLRSLVDGGRQGLLPMDASVPPLLKRSLFWLVDKFWVDRILAPPINSFRSSLGLPPVSRILRDYIHSPQSVIGLFPEWFAPIQPDWPPHTHLAGFVLHDDSERRAMGPEVEEFLAAGPPPLVFTPGSAAATLTKFFRESVDACRIAGYRAMLVTNFPDQLPRDLPPGVRAFSYLPFSRILPRCSALVYPGGIGTMAQAIKAGIPHLIVPHGHDQPDNAFRIERLGLGYGIYPIRYRAPRVVRTLSRLLASSEIRARCADYSKRIDSTAALKQACDRIESLGRGAPASVGHAVASPKPATQNA